MQDTSTHPNGASDAATHGNADAKTSAQALLRRMFDAAVASAQPAHCVPPHLPTPQSLGTGRLIVIGFNPVSLWGTQQWRSVLAQRMGSGAPAFIPDIDDLIGHRRLRDWLRLLGFEVERSSFGCWRPAFTSENWLQRAAWMDEIGERWYAWQSK